MPRLVFSFYFFLSFFFIVGRIVDGFAFLCFSLRLGRKEGGREGREDGWIDGWKVVSYHIISEYFSWIGLN